MHTSTTQGQFKPSMKTSKLKPLINIKLYVQNAVVSPFHHRFAEYLCESITCMFVCTGRKICKVTLSNTVAYQKCISIEKLHTYMQIYFSVCFDKSSSLFFIVYIINIQITYLIESTYYQYVSGIIEKRCYHPLLSHRLVMTRSNIDLFFLGFKLILFVRCITCCYKCLPCRALHLTEYLWNVLM